MSESIYCVYRHTSPDGKSYIGVTNNFYWRTKGHQDSPVNEYMREAISLFGWDNFTHEIIANKLTLSEVNAAEIQYITELNTIWPNGYNIKPGGGYNPKRRKGKTREERAILRAAWYSKNKNVSNNTKQPFTYMFWFILCSLIPICYNRLLDTANEKYPHMTRINSGDKIADHKHNRQIALNDRARAQYISSHTAGFTDC